MSADLQTEQKNADLADRTEGVALNTALGIDLQELRDAFAMVAERARTQPRALWESAQYLMRQLFAITVGSSDIEPGQEDPRFNTQQFQQSPYFRRVGQSFFAWSKALDMWLDQSGIDGRDRDRAEFVLRTMREVLVPVNWLLGNPAAVAKLVTTRGASLLSGLRNIIDDVQHNHGYPAVADRHAFQVGVDVAATRGKVVYRNEMFELMQYQPKTAQVGAIPLLYVFSQVNRFYLGDLTPDRSLFQELLDAGIQVFAISWNNPTPAQSSWGLGAYADSVIRGLKVMSEITGQPKVNLIGVCAGGLTASVAAGVLKARGDELIHSLSLFINTLDNRTADSDFGLFVTDRSIEALKLRSRTRGVFPERNVFEMFAWLRLEENVLSFYRSNYLLGEKPPAHPLLFWSMDYTRLPAELHCDFLDLTKENKLAKRELQMLGHRVDLKAIDYDVYMMAGSTDHITPWKACYRSVPLFGSKFGGNIEFVLTNQNHTQTISARGDNRHLKYWTAAQLPDTADQFVEVAQETRGSWRAHWVNWLKARSGDSVAAPQTLGSVGYPCIDDAPGKYVLQR